MGRNELDMVAAQDRAAANFVSRRLESASADYVLIRDRIESSMCSLDIGEFIPLDALMAAYQIGDATLIGEVMQKARSLWLDRCVMCELNGFQMPANAPDIEDECVAHVALYVAKRAGVV